MEQTVITCDKCKKKCVTDGFWNSGYKKVELTFGQYNHKTFDLCPECLKKYGLLDDKDKEKSVEEQSTSDKLYDVIAEIVAENIAE